jgi:RNA polymerase sigma-70 factor, ECF subfamily
MAPESRRTFEAAATRELALLYRISRRLTRKESDAEDLVSQTLFLAARAWGSFDGRYPRSWFIRIMKNEHLRTIRSSRSEAPTVALEEAPEIAASSSEWHDLDARLIGDSVIEELDKLPEEYRLAVSLCDSEGLSYQEAADALEVPVGTVRSRLFRGRRILRERLAWMQHLGGEAA